jgi:hypothetical protein
MRASPDCSRLFLFSHASKENKEFFIYFENKLFQKNKEISLFSS